MKTDKVYYELKFRYMTRLQMPIRYEDHLLVDRYVSRAIPRAIPRAIHDIVTEPYDYYLEAIDDLKEYRKNIMLRNQYSKI
jgi:hypothetical protein